MVGFFLGKEGVYVGNFGWILICDIGVFEGTSRGRIRCGAYVLLRVPRPLRGLLLYLRKTHAPHLTLVDYEGKSASLWLLDRAPEGSIGLGVLRR